MYFCNYCWLNPCLLPNKEKFGDVDCLVSLKCPNFFYNILFFCCIFFFQKDVNSAKHGKVSVCPPGCLSPALILALCHPSQETHHFLGKQSCYYTILVHRCSVLTDRLMQAEGKGNVYWCQSLTATHKCSLWCQCFFKRQHGALSVILFPIGMQQQFATDECTRLTMRACLSFFL